jgi:hypothetical protein
VDFQLYTSGTYQRCINLDRRSAAGIDYGSPNCLTIGFYGCHFI